LKVFHCERTITRLLNPADEKEKGSYGEESEGRLGAEGDGSNAVTTAVGADRNLGRLTVEFERDLREDEKKKIEELCYL
jgi:hypothetical protein